MIANNAKVVRRNGRNTAETLPENEKLEKTNPMYLH